MSNVCVNCSDKSESDLVADTGVCFMCGLRGDCWDFDLLAFYRAFGLSNEFIWQYLPRLLEPNLDGDRVSMEEIAQAIRSEHAIGTIKEAADREIEKMRQRAEHALRIHRSIKSKRDHWKEKCGRMSKKLDALQEEIELLKPI